MSSSPIEKESRAEVEEEKGGRHLLVTHEMISNVLDNGQVVSVSRPSNLGLGTKVRSLPV